MDQGGAGFAIAHPLQIGHFLAFEVLTYDAFKVTVFDRSCTEVLIKCGQHKPPLAMIGE